MTRKERAVEIARRLRATYPDSHCELEYGSAFELLVATILSAQCTDKRVNIVTPELFRTHRTPADFASVSQADLEAKIRSTGFFRHKAKNIRAMAQAILDLHGGEVPRDMESLAALPGVGRKTANVVLGNAFNLNVGFVVDTHIGRLARRFRFTRHVDPVKVEQDLMRTFPVENWMILSHDFIWHGRRRCTARRPDCAGCELADICPSAGKV